jgi:hypothetical protein
MFAMPSSVQRQGGEDGPETVGMVVAVDQRSVPARLNYGLWCMGFDTLSGRDEGAGRRVHRGNDVCQAYMRSRQAMLYQGPAKKELKTEEPKQKRAQPQRAPKVVERSRKAPAGESKGCAWGLEVFKCDTCGISWAFNRKRGDRCAAWFPHSSSPCYGLVSPVWL